MKWLRFHGEFAKDLAYERVRREGFGRGEAEDVAQDAWLRMLRMEPAQVDAVANPRAYIATVVLNAARAWLAAHRREGTPLREACPEAPEDALMAREDLERLRAALSTLEPDDRLVLRWIYWEGLSYAAVAGLLGVSPNSVGPLLSRARERLREKL